MSDPNPPQRKTVRLRGFDYAKPGAYFITICTHEKQHLFGEVVDQEMRLSDLGRIVQEDWQNLPRHYPQVTLDEFVVMPNHLHGILFIGDSMAGSQTDGASQKTDVASHLPTGVHAPAGSLSTIVGNLKSGITRRIRERVGRPIRVWQDGFIEHVIRDQTDLDNHRHYTRDNPLKWGANLQDPYA